MKRAPEYDSELQKHKKVAASATEADSQEMLSVSVQSMTGDAVLLPVQLPSSTPVKELQTLVGEVVGKPAFSISLVHNTEELATDLSLCSAGVTNDAVLTSVISALSESVLELQAQFLKIGMCEEPMAKPPAILPEELKVMLSAARAWIFSGFYLRPPGGREEYEELLCLDEMSEECLLSGPYPGQPKCIAKGWQPFCTVSEFQELFVCLDAASPNYGAVQLLFTNSAGYDLITPAPFSNFFRLLQQFMQAKVDRSEAGCEGLLRFPFDFVSYCWLKYFNLDDLVAFIDDSSKGHLRCATVQKMHPEHNAISLSTKERLWDPADLKLVKVGEQVEVIPCEGDQTWKRGFLLSLHPLTVRIDGGTCEPSLSGIKLVRPSFKIGDRVEVWLPWTVQWCPGVVAEECVWRFQSWLGINLEYEGRHWVCERNSWNHVRHAQVMASTSTERAAA